MIATLREWFAANRPLIFFAYGQVFFVMGLAIALQSRRYSRLDLARSLPWLAAFGIAHGFNEWGDLFIPIQAQFLPDPLIHFLRGGQTILLAASFACLLQFGVKLLQPLPDRWRWVRFLPGGVVLLWLLGPFWGSLQLTSCGGRPNSASLPSACRASTIPCAWPASPWRPMRSWAVSSRPRRLSSRRMC
ncbi:MAG: hypothetical protein HY784_00665 [Chloroflexi bacterium]|nr:hypothetical protein [Chloroflexota bacterium]